MAACLRGSLLAGCLAGRPGGISAIGGTPVVRLAHLADEGCAEVWVKMEAANPTGSYKDRMALAMIEAAEADGRLDLRPGFSSSSWGARRAGPGRAKAARWWPTQGPARRHRRAGRPWGPRSRPSR